MTARDISLPVPNPLVTHAHGARDQTVQRIEEAKRAIEADIERNSGIYPYKTTITQAEVCRRAGINRMTLQKEQHRQTRDDLKAWLDELAKKIASGAKVVRRAVTERIEDYKAAYEGIAQAYHEAELEHAERAAKLAEAEAEVGRLRARVAELEARNSELAAVVNEGKIVPIGKGKPDGR